MFVVGLTGGIGSGKTQASNWFAQQGITIIDADVIAHAIVKSGMPTLQKIVDKFGDWVLTAQGELDRQAMRNHVFGRPQALMDLEQITHPAIRETAQASLKSATSTYVILVAPLLLEGSEAGLVNLCDRVLVIDTTEVLQLRRASQRDGQSQERITHIMANQLSRQERLAKADDVVENMGNLEDLYRQLEPLHQKYLKLAKQK